MQCKVVCNAKLRHNPANNETQLCFTPVITGSDENKLFFKYTPGGMVYFNVVSEATADSFTVGKEYYINFSEASK